MVLSKDIKKAIAFGLIMGVILSLCNFCFGVEDISFDVVRNIGITNDGRIINAQNDGIGYFAIEPGYKYYIQRIPGSFKMVFSNSIPSNGVETFDFFTGHEVYFTYSQYQYAFVDFGTVPVNGESQYIVTREPLEGMGGFIDELAYSLSVNGVWDTVLACVPLIAICVLFGFGVFNIVRFIRLIIKIRGGM